MRNQHPAVLLRGLDLVESLALYGLPVGTVLFALPGATEAYRVPKDALAQAVIAIFIAAWTLKHLWAADLGEAFRALREVPSLLPLGCFVVWMFVTAAVSPYSRRSFTVELNVVLFFLLYMLSFNEWNPARVRRWITLVTLAGILNGIIVLFQRAKVPLGDYLSYDVNWYDRDRTAGLIGNPNDVGSYLVLALLLALTGLLTARGRLPQAIYAVVLVFLCVLLAWNETYTAIAALGAALLLSFALLVWMRPRLIYPAALFVLLVAFAGAGAAYWLRATYPEARSRLLKTVFAVRARDWNEVLHGRYFTWVMTAAMIRDRPFWGHGPGAFSCIFFDYLLRFKAAHPDARFLPRTGYFDQAHNDYLQIAAEMGVPALLLLAWIAGSFLCNVRSALRRAAIRAPAHSQSALRESKRGKAEHAGLMSEQTALPLLGIASLAAMLITGLAGFPFRLAITMSLFVPMASMSLSPVKDKV